jgi:transcription termination factor Rho
MPKPYFNVAGPCNPGEHYMIDPLRGIGDELMDLIDRNQYFVIHAARQSGKTTLLKELARKINAEKKYYALYCSLEVMQELADPEKGMPEIVGKIESCLKKQGLPEGFAKNANYSRITHLRANTGPALACKRYCLRSC